MTVAHFVDTGALLARTFTDVVDPADELDDTGNRILDAAHEQFCHAGIQRSTMTDVARRAGVSRITVYRRFATKEALVEHVVRREFRRYFDRFRADVAGADTAADRVVVGFVSALRAITSNPLIGGLLASEPDQVVPSMIDDEGRTLTTVAGFVAGQLRREQQAGTVSADLDVDLVAEMMVRISGSYLAIPSRIVDVADDRQLADLARRFLVPMLEP